MRNISLFTYFLPFILAALLVMNAADAKAELKVMDSEDSSPISNFNSEGWKDYFTSLQWTVLNSGYGTLVVDSTRGNDFGLTYSQAIQFVTVGTTNETFDPFDYKEQVFTFTFTEDGMLSSLVFNGSDDGDDWTEDLTVDFNTTAVLQNGNSTPEPATLLIFGAGLAGAGLVARRRRKS